MRRGGGGCGGGKGQGQHEKQDVMPGGTNRFCVFCAFSIVGQTGFKQCEYSEFLLQL